MIRGIPAPGERYVFTTPPKEYTTKDVPPTHTHTQQNNNYKEYFRKNTKNINRNPVIKILTLLGNIYIGWP